MAKKTKSKNKDNNSGKDIVSGKLEITRGGMGFVIVEGREKDIIIKRENVGNALNGDIVNVAVKGVADTNRRQEGTITGVVKRKQSEFSGRVEVHTHFAFLMPDSDKMPVDIYVPLHLLNGATNGDRAIA